MHIRILFSVSALVMAAPMCAQASKTKIDFQKQIWPILEKSCVECHAAPHALPNGRMSKPKGGVTLDSKDGITTSKKGKVVVAKKPDESLMYGSISLPADDDDRMPPKKKTGPLAKEQQELIKKWIEEGANFGDWKGKAASEEKPKDEPGKEKEGEGDKPKEKGKDKETDKPKDKPKEKEKSKGTTEAALLSLQKGLSPVGAAALESLANGPFQVASIGDDSPLLAVSCAGRNDEVDDKAVQSLAPIADHITDLSLARTRVSDAGCAALAKMTRLTSLDLRQTQIGNQGVASLAACTELRTLNLFGTQTGDYALAALAGLKNLEQLYLWQTEASAQAAVRLRDAVPSVRIVMTADLPEPMAEGSQPKRRAR